MDLITPLNDAKYGGQTTTYTGTAGTVTGWPAGPRGVLVTPTTDAYVRVGEGVTATTADTMVPAYASRPFSVPIGSGSTWTVSVIQVSAGGTFFAKPLQG